MSVNNQLVYSFEARLAKYKMIVNSYKNFLFVEDDFEENFYELFFENLLEISLEDKKILILPFGCKNNVINAYNDLEKASNGKNFYLVDGDFDRLKNFTTYDAPNFHMLEKYNIESYLFEEQPIKNFLSINHNLRKNEINRLINLSLWYSDTLVNFSKLFFCFALLQDLNPTPQNVEMPKSCFIDYKMNMVSDENINIFISEWKNKISNYNNKMDNIVQKYDTLHKNDFSYLICGKWIMELLRVYLCNKLSKSIDLKALKRFLCSNCAFDSLDILREKLKIFLGI